MLLLENFAKNQEILSVIFVVFLFSISIFYLFKYDVLPPLLFHRLYHGGSNVEVCILRGGGGGGGRDRGIARVGSVVKLYITSSHPGEHKPPSSIVA